MIKAPGRKSKYRGVQKTYNGKAGKGNARSLRFARRVGSQFESEARRAFNPSEESMQRS